MTFYSAPGDFLKKKVIANMEETKIIEESDEETDSLVIPMGRNNKRQSIMRGAPNRASPRPQS